MKIKFLAGICVGWGLTFAALAQAAEATPFDQRLVMSHFFEEPSIRPLTGHTPSPNALFSVARSFRYSPDGPRDRWQSARETESIWKGDCEDKAIWLSAALRKYGYRNVRLVVGKARAADPRLHAWTEFQDKEGNNWILDPTMLTRPWKKEVFGKDSYKPLYSFTAKTQAERRKHPAS